MQRILFTIQIGNGMPVFGYGLFLMLGFVAALILARFRAKKYNLSNDSIMDVGLISIFFGVIGARLAYLLLDYHPVDGDYGTFKEWIAVWNGGLTFQGGLFLALLAAFIYLRWRKISVGAMFDAYAPSLALGVGFGRIGCLFNGCCWGSPAANGSFFSMYFPAEIEPMAMQHYLHDHQPIEWIRLITTLGYPQGTEPLIPIYATQIISVVGLFFITAGLIWAERHWRIRPSGQVITWFLFAYGLGRFFIEFWRDDTPLRYGVGAFEGLRLGQWLAIAMIAAGLIIHLVIRKDKIALEA